MSEVTNFAELEKSVADSLQKLENDYVTKASVAKLNDEIKALHAEMGRQAKAQKRHRYFGTQADAELAIDSLRNAIQRSPYGQRIDKRSDFYVQKNDLNSYGTGTGAELIPTQLSDQLSMLIQQGGVARSDWTVIDGVQGNIEFNRRASVGTSVGFTAGGDASLNGGLRDDVAVTPDAPTISKLTLSPKQVVGLSLVSEKLLYSSAVSVAELVYRDMVEQARVLEDNSVLRGDGTSNTYGDVLGVYSDPDVGEDTVANGSFSLDKCLTLPTHAHESVIDGTFYMNRHTFANIKTQKASTSGVYFYDPELGAHTIGGFPIRIWNRMDSIGVSKFPVLFASFKSSGLVAIGREMKIDIDKSYRFNYVQDAFRLVYDFDAGLIQPSAVARLSTT